MRASARSSSTCIRPSPTTMRPLSGTSCAEGSWTERHDDVVAAGDAGEDPPRLLAGAIEIADDEQQPVVGDDVRRLRSAASRRAGGLGQARRCRGGGEGAVADGHRSRRRRTAARLRRAGTAARPASERTRPPTRSPGEDAPGGERGDLGGGGGLHGADRAEEHRLPLVDENERRAVALLLRDPHVRGAGAGGDLPVDRAHVVAGEVGAELDELEAPAPHPGWRSGRTGRCRPAGAASRSRARVPRARRDGARCAGRWPCSGDGDELRMSTAWRRAPKAARRLVGPRRRPDALRLGEARRSTSGAMAWTSPGRRVWPCSQA